MFPVKIESVAEYNYCTGRGFDPLIDTSHFAMDIQVRRTVQRLKFGNSNLNKGDVLQANQRYYIYMWEMKPHYCEECMRPLYNYSAIHISHILARGSHAEIAHDPRNSNILCAKHHAMWESKDRKRMRIFERNMCTISLLKHEYNIK